MSEYHKQYKVAAVQSAPAYLDLGAGIKKACGLIREAADNGASLIAFPETWFPGYPFWIWLNSPAAGMHYLQRYVDNSLVINSVQYQTLCTAARDNNIHVLLGFSERKNGTLYIAQSLIGPDGNPINHRRKVKPTHMERTIFGEGDGSDLKVSETELGMVGALNCWEHLQPLNRYALYSQNEQLHIASWPSFSLYTGLAYALGPELNMASSATYAAEGQCFVIAACGIVSPEMLEILDHVNPEMTLLQTGGGHAMIFGPDGKPLCDPLDPDEEGLLYADLDFSQIIIAKATADPVGHYARPDVTRLLFNDQPQRPVEKFTLFEPLPSNPPEENIPSSEEDST
ncbi:MAG: carbon-nitrogen hydrolase family protein [Emcibacter sp.]|nr:carbon-nitrogen hydrolase family protein [Emcibacter sp.]